MKRNRKWMEETIRDGGSVIHKGVHYLRIEDLPTEAELAKGDDAEEKAAKESITAEIERLKNELSILEPEAPKKSEAKKEEPKKEEPKAPEVKTTEAAKK